MAKDNKSAGPRYSVFGPGGKLFGKSQEGAHHWWMQRVITAIGLPLMIASILIIACGTGRGPVRMLEVLSRPWATIIIGATAFLMIAHMRHAVHQILEDYVPTKKPRYIAFMMNEAFCVVVALMIAYAMFKLSVLSAFIGFMK